MEECMEKGYIKKGNVAAISMAVWGMVHGLVSLKIRERFDKLAEPGELKELMHQSLNWLVSSIDRSGKG